MSERGNNLVKEAEPKHNSASDQILLYLCLHGGVAKNMKVIEDYFHNHSHKRFVEGYIYLMEEKQVMPKGREIHINRNNRQCRVMLAMDKEVLHHCIEVAKEFNNIKYQRSKKGVDKNEQALIAMAEKLIEKPELCLRIASAGEDEIKNIIGERKPKKSFKIVKRNKTFL